MKFTPPKYTKSPYTMVEFDDAIEMIREETMKCLKSPRTEIVSLDDLIHGAPRVLAEDIVSHVNIPSSSTSVMDGFALRSEDQNEPLEIVGESLAGHAFAPTLLKGQAVYVTTGSVVPEGANAVVKIEWTQISGNIVTLTKKVNEKQWIRETGSDIKSGSIVLERNSRLGASEMALLASIGVTLVKVFRRPVVAVISTGDEIATDSKPITDGIVFDANRPMLLRSVRDLGGEPVDFGIITDKGFEASKILSKAIEECDIVVTSGGVSMGKADFVKDFLESNGKVHFGRVRMKPGKPTTFSTVLDENGVSKLCFGLPGNPVSCFVTFRLFAALSIKLMSFQVDPTDSLAFPKISCETLDDIVMDPERMEFHRAVASFDWSKSKFVAASTGNQVSSRLISTRSSNTLLFISRGTGVLPKGSNVNALMIGEPSDSNLRSDGNLVKMSCGKNHRELVQVRIGLLVCSDRVSRGETVDGCVDAFKKAMESSTGFLIVIERIVPDDCETIENVLREWSESSSGIDVIFSMGGTGFSERDVTPEATRRVIEREAPGISQTILIKSLQTVPMAMLSRGISGIRNQTIIVNLVGKPEGVAESIQFIWHAIPHAVRLLKGDSKVH